MSWRPWQKSSNIVAPSDETAFQRALQRWGDERLGVAAELESARTCFTCADYGGCPKFKAMVSLGARSFAVRAIPQALILGSMTCDFHMNAKWVGDFVNQSKVAQYMKGMS